MKYKLVQRANPLKKEAAAKWYANAVNEGKISKREIAKEIASRSSLTAGDVSNVIDNLIDELPKYLLMGKSISLGEFGTFRLSLSSEGAESPESFNTNMISSAKVVFTPGTALKDSISRISYVRTNEGSVEVEAN